MQKVEKVMKWYGIKIVISMMGSLFFVFFVFAFYSDTCDSKYEFWNEPEEILELK